MSAELRADGTPKSRFELVNHLHEAAKLVDWDDDDGDVCRVCGCTDREACPGGCWWFYDSGDTRGPLCSSCALANEPTS